MQIKRARVSFRTGSSIPGTRGAHEGDLVPENHPLVSRFPQHFEDAEDFVARRYPELYGRERKPRRGLLGRGKAKEAAPVPVEAGVVEQPPPSDVQPQRPPVSGPGSGVNAWRQYAAEATGSSAESFATLTRDEIVAVLDSEGVDDGQE